MRFPFHYYIREFEKRTRELERAFQKGDVQKTICYLKYLSNFYYKVNYKLTDDRLEEITQRISQKYLGRISIVNANKETLLFYDNFGLKNRGLANIYVNAFDKLGYRIVWILYSYAPELNEIQEMYKLKKNISFYIIPQEPILDRMKIFQDIIKKISPKNIFIYTTPDDVGGIGTLSTIEGDVTRYLIDLTDHAFWLGKCAADWIVGFRNYGYNVAVQYRKVSQDKVILLPYYPDTRRYPFEGMPFDLNKHEFVFSGGSLYKIEGDSVYGEIVRYILNNYTNVKFVFAGNGSNQTIKGLEKDYPDRFFHVAERKDLDAVLKHAKFYLSTYPITGALMVQYALQNQCIPLTLCKGKGSESDPKTWLLSPQKSNFVFYSKKDIFAEIDRLMNDKEYYLKVRSSTEKQVISEDEFIMELNRILIEQKTIFSGQKQKIDMDKFLELYRNNATYEQFCSIIYESRNKWVYKKHPLIVRKMKKQEKHC